MREASQDSAPSKTPQTALYSTGSYSGEPIRTRRIVACVRRSGRQVGAWAPFLATLHKIHREGARQRVQGWSAGSGTCRAHRQLNGLGDGVWDRCLGRWVARLDREFRRPRGRWQAAAGGGAGGGGGGGRRLKVLLLPEVGAGRKASMGAQRPVSPPLKTPKVCHDATTCCTLPTTAASVTSTVAALRARSHRRCPAGG